VGKLFGFLFVLLLIVGAGAGGLWFYGQHVYTQPGPATPDGAPRIVAIPKGLNAQAIAATLKDAGAIEDDFQFRMAVRALDMLPGAEKVTLKAGEYVVPSAASLMDVVALLESGKSLQYTAIIPEGLTSAMIIKLLADNEWKGEGDAAASMKLTGEPPLVPAEGVMLPGGYVVHRGDTIESVVQSCGRTVSPACPSRPGKTRSISPPSSRTRPACPKSGPWWLRCL
jgi:UPF0755 protein